MPIVLIDVDHMRDKTQEAHLLVDPTTSGAAPLHNKLNFTDVMTYVMKPARGVFPVILVSTNCQRRSLLPCEWAYLPMPCTSAVQIVHKKLKIDAKTGPPEASDARVLRSSPQAPKGSASAEAAASAEHERPLRQSPRRGARPAESPPQQRKRGREE